MYSRRSVAAQGRLLIKDKRQNKENTAETNLVNLVANHRNNVLQSAEIEREQIERNVKEVTG